MLQYRIIASSADNNTCILPRNQSPGVSDSQEGGVVNSSSTFLNPLVRTNSLDRKRTVGFFPLASRALLARFARVRLLRHALPISLLILRKKPTVLQSNISRTGLQSASFHFLFQIDKSYCLNASIAP